MATMKLASRLSRADPSIIVTIRRSAGRHCSRRRCGGVFSASGTTTRRYRHDDPFGDTMRQLLQRRWPTLVADSPPMRDEQDSIVEEEADEVGVDEYDHEKVANRLIKHKLQVEVSDDGNIVHINFGDGTHSSPYHASWLWSNDPKFVHQASGQRESTPGKYCYNRQPKITSARIIYCYTNDDGIAHNIADEYKDLQFPGPTMGDSCHPLATYGQLRTAAWMKSKASSLHGNITTLGSYLRVEWNTDHTISMYDMKWLNRFRYDDHSRIEHRTNSEVTPLHAIRKVGAPSWYSTISHSKLESSISQSRHDDVDGLVHIDYHSIVAEDGKFPLLHHVFRDGAVIVTNAPSPSNEDGDKNKRTASSEEDNYPVAKVARAMSGGHLSHGSLYGDIFHVRDDPGSNNVAYTSHELCPHQDLAYYESPPGMQLLHCVANGSGVVGGESLLIDAMAAAYRLREIKPESFEILTRCPATFVKQREGACMTYRTPHIVLAAEEEGKSSGYNIDREIVAVWWSPPFEGPVYLPPEQVDGYYEAYADFERIFNQMIDIVEHDDLSHYAYDYTWDRRLKPGEILVFNNRRMLHGRRGFSVAEGATSEEGRRHLVGCYTNIDDTLNSYRLLLRDHFEYDRALPILNVGNGTTIIP